MGTTCKIRCKHCGAQLDHPTLQYTVSHPTRERASYIETEHPMRCPACHHRLNSSPEEFRAQVEFTYAWG